MADGGGWEKLDEALDKTGVGHALDGMAAFLFGDSLPTSTLRFKGSPAALAGFLPYRGYMHEDKLFENLNSIGWVLELQPLTQTGEAVEAILQGLFEEGFPDDIHVQVHTYASPYVGNDIERWAYERVKRGGVLERLGRSRAEYLRRMIWSSGSKVGPFYARDYRVFISVGMTKKNVGKAAEKLMQLRETVQMSLQTLGLWSEPLTADALMSVVSGWLAMSRETRKKRCEYDPGEFICDQMIRADTSLEVYRDRLIAESHDFGVESYMKGRLSSRRPYKTRQEIRTFTAARFPKNGSQALMAGLLGDFTQDQLRLVGSWWSTLKISYMSAEASKAQAQMRSSRAAQQYKSPFKNMYPQMIAKADEWKEVNGEVQDGARLVKFCYSVMLQTPEGTGEEAERALRSLYRVRGFELERNDCCHLPVMLSCLPMGYADNFHKDLGQLKYLRTGVTRSMPALAPMQGQPKAAYQPGTLIMSRLGQISYFSPFQNEGNGNHNMSVTGASGSGKSVFMQSVCVDGLAQSHHVMVIDDGRSFETLCKIMDGDHVVFRADRAICLNPFSMISEDVLENREDLMSALNMITQVVVMMAKGDEKATKEEVGLIDGLVSEVFADKGPSGSVSDVRHALVEEGSELAKRLGRAMGPYCKKGTFGSFFEGPATLDLQNPFTVFEMSDLESKPELRAVVVLCLLFQIAERMRMGGRQQRKLVVIDEAWQMLGGGQAGAFIEGFARRARKEGGALITGTQSINDYYKSDGSRAAFENSDWKVVLRITEQEADGLAGSKRLPLDDGSLSILKGLRMSPGEYSEMIIFGPGQKLLGRLVLDPFSATLFSTSPAVYAAIQRGQEQGRTLPDIIEAIAYGEQQA